MFGNEKSCFCIYLKTCAFIYLYVFLCPFGNLVGRTGSSWANQTAGND